ncbi:MAG: S26 family signal peptidase [Planctomycetota bacterium]|nr:S26 family signal peptidase [Planctomycetota bacterium]
MKNKAFLRWFRRGLIVLALGLAYLAQRPYTLLTVPEQDASMDPIYPPGALLLVERLSPDDPLERDMDIVYAIVRDDVEYARYGRIGGLEGDVVAVHEGQLTINGEPTSLSAEVALGAVPSGTVLVLNVNPQETLYVDSRSLGFIERSRIRHRIRARISSGN